MYEDILGEQRKQYRLNNLHYVLLYGVVGWGIICAVNNMTFAPFESNTIIAGLISLPFYGIILGIISRKMFNTRGYIKTLYLENIKGKNIKSIKKKNNTLQMK